MAVESNELIEAARLLREWAANSLRGSAGAACPPEIQFAAAQLEAAAEKIRHQSDELAQVSRNSDRFISNISHELRTPLTPALLIISALQMDPTLPPHIRGELSAVREQLDLEARLVDDLLDNSRLTRGRMQLRMEAVDLRALVGGVVASKQAQEPAGPKLSLDYQARQRRVHADPARLRQIFSKLLQNAFKFTPLDGTVQVIATDDGKSIIIEVRDSGRGFDPQLAGQIFQAFEHGKESLAQNFGGLGLGLAIARGLAQLHGGDLTASSPGVGKGATFRLSLPAMGDAPEPDTSQKKRTRILLVEDDGQSRLATGRLLEMMGYIVRTAGTVAAAIPILQAEPIDILLCDIQLPDGDGWQLMRDAQKIRPIKGLALSGFGSEEHIRKSLECGYFAHLVKPFTMAGLTEAIEKAAGATSLN